MQLLVVMASVVATLQAALHAAYELQVTEQENMCPG